MIFVELLRCGSGASSVAERRISLTIGSMQFSDQRARSATNCHLDSAHLLNPEFRSMDGVAAFGGK
jgi:hypothetical protein